MAAEKITQSNLTLARQYSKMMTQLSLPWERDEQELKIQQISDFYPPTCLNVDRHVQKLTCVL